MEKLGIKNSTLGRWYRTQLHQSTDLLGRLRLIGFDASVEAKGSFG